MKINEHVVNDWGFISNIHNSVNLCLINFAASLSQHLEAISKYGFPKNDEKYLTFQVRACKEAIIALTDGKTTYEVRDEKGNVRWS